MTPRTCLDCPKPISRSSKGRCRTCFNAHANLDPTIKERRAEGLRRKFAADPEYRASCAHRLQAANATPEAIEKRREHGRRQYREYLSRPDIRAKSNGPDARRRAGLKTTETRLGWCPPEHREEYLRLVRWKHIPAVDARRMIEERIAGTAAHAARTISNTVLKQRLRAEREREQAY